MVETPLTLVDWLVSGKAFCVKELQKMLLTLWQIPDKKADSLVMSQPGKNGLTNLEQKIDPY